MAGPWVILLLLLGVPLFSRFGPQAYIVPPFILVYRAIRRDESGRMAVMGWYDKIGAQKLSPPPNPQSITAGRDHRPRPTTPRRHHTPATRERHLTNGRAEHPGTGAAG